MISSPVVSPHVLLFIRCIFALNFFNALYLNSTISYMHQPLAVRFLRQNAFPLDFAVVCIWFLFSCKVFFSV